MISYAPDSTKAGRELSRAQSKSLVDKKTMHWLQHISRFLKCAMVINCLK